MQSLDLRNVRCPLALVLLKQKLHMFNANTSIQVQFSNQASMQDIRLYLDKKNYCYSCYQNTLLVKLGNH